MGRSRGRRVRISSLMVGRSIPCSVTGLTSHREELKQRRRDGDSHAVEKRRDIGRESAAGDIFLEKRDNRTASSLTASAPEPMCVLRARVGRGRRACTERVWTRSRARGSQRLGSEPRQGHASDNG